MSCTLYRHNLKMLKMFHFNFIRFFMSISTPTVDWFQALWHIPHLARGHNCSCSIRKPRLLSPALSLHKKLELSPSHFLRECEGGESKTEADTWIIFGWFWRKPTSLCWPMSPAWREAAVCWCTGIFTETRRAFKYQFFRNCHDPSVNPNCATWYVNH